MLFSVKKIKNVRRLFFLNKIYISAFWGYQNAGWQTQEKRREVRAKFNGVSVRRFTQNAYMYMRIGVFHQNAGMRAPEWTVFFCVLPHYINNQLKEVLSHLPLDLRPLSTERERERVCE